MKIYLAVPLQKNRNNYLATGIYKILKGFGCKILSEWVLWNDPNPNLKPIQIYKRDSNAINSCDVLVADVSNPSIGVGMEIMLAFSLDKKIICIHKKKNISNFLRGMPGVSIISYSTFHELNEKLRRTIFIINKENPVRLKGTRSAKTR